MSAIPSRGRLILSWAGNLKLLQAQGRLLWGASRREPTKLSHHLHELGNRNRTDVSHDKVRKVHESAD
eukprot:1857241-Amphidinium_carterae.1